MSLTMGKFCVIPKGMIFCLSHREYGQHQPFQIIQRMEQKLFRLYTHNTKCPSPPLLRYPLVWYDFLSVNRKIRPPFKTECFSLLHE